MKKSRLESLLDLLDKDPKDSFIKYGIALEYLSAKDYSRAENYFKLILTDDPAYIPAYLQYGQLKASHGSSQEARELFQKGIEIAKQAGDKHAAKEMEDFLDELE